MLLSSCLAICCTQVVALMVQADNLKGKSSPYIKNYVNYGSDDSPEAIPQERALNARPGKLGDPAPALQHRKISPVPGLPLGHQQASSQTVLQGHIDLLSSACHGAGIMLDSIKTPATIVQVRGGSPAYYAGVCRNDIVDSYNLKGENLVLTLRRNGALYSATMRTIAPQPGETPAQPKADDRPLLTGSTEKKEVWQQLSLYQLALLVDRSGSMQETIAQGNDSRWLWAAKVVQSFAAEAQTIAGKTIALCTFASDYQINYNIQPSQVAEIFRNLRPNGGTRLVPPLKELIDNYFRSNNRERLLALVVTDGTPDDFQQLKALIIETSKRITYPGQVEIIFVGIGEDMAGRSVFNYLDHTIQEEGAAADIVEQIPFAEVSGGNLDSAMAKALGARQR
jgi:Mg-chelatase subunit ChlD